MIEVVGSAASQPSSAYSVAATPSIDQTPKTASTGRSQRSNRKNDNITGSTITYVPGRRVTKQFPITEHELNQIVDGGRTSSKWFSVCAFCISFIIGLFKDIIITPSLPEQTKHWIYWVAGLFALASLLSFLFGFHQNRSSRTLVDSIKKETNF
jgi:hypothetical protein